MSGGILTVISKKQIIFRADNIGPGNDGKYEEIGSVKLKVIQFLPAQ